MSSAGNPNQTRLPWLPLILLALGLLLAGYIGTSVIGVLYGLAAPPEPPLPRGLTQLEYTSEGHGQDEWTYATDLTPAEIAAFYREQGGQCAPDGESIRCDGERTFSVFAMRWEVEIMAARLHVARQVSWMGYFPTRTPIPTTENRQFRK